MQTPPIATNLTIKSECIASNNSVVSAATAITLPSTATTRTTTTTAHYQQHSAKFNGFEQYTASASARTIRQTNSLPASVSCTSTPLLLSYNGVTATTAGPSGVRSTGIYTLPDITSGCSRTVPIPWTHSHNIGGNASATSSLIHVSSRACSSTQTFICNV